MQPLVVVPSQKQSRADQCKSRGTYLSDEQDNRIVDDDSIVDQERDSWRKYCASLFRKGLAPFPSDAAVSPPTSVHVKDRHDRADITNINSPECTGQQLDIRNESELVSDDDDEWRGSDMPVADITPMLTVRTPIITTCCNIDCSRSSFDSMYFVVPRWYTKGTGMG